VRFDIFRETGHELSRDSEHVVWNPRGGHWSWAAGGSGCWSSEPDRALACFRPRRALSVIAR
jgi:hypothetical protein